MLSFLAKARDVKKSFSLFSFVEFHSGLGDASYRADKS